MFDSIDEARKILTVLIDSLERKGEFPHADEVRDMITALQQLVDIVAAVDEQGKVLTPEEITDIGAQGLQLIDELAFKLASQQLESERQDVEQVALVLARWVIAHQGTLTNIQSIVNAFAYLSNAVHDKATLAQLAAFAGQVAHACSDAIKQDVDNSNPMRPWRILHLNRGIVATRSHELELMRRVYAELIEAIPMDAPGFFKEGMSEMEHLNYPSPVRELMQEFYARTTLPSVH